MKKNKTAFLGMMTCLALIFSYVESLIPIPIPIPGIKLGLANLLTVILLYAVGPWEAFAVNVVRVVLSGFLFGSLSAILYSLAGCAVSFLAMAALKKSGRFSAVGVSIAGGSAHNIGQILVAALVLDSVDLFFYAPVLLIAERLPAF